MVKMSLVYEGGLRCRATHGPSGNTLETDAPLDNRGRGESFSPTDLVATALASCMATIMGMVADRHGWSLDGMRLEVSKEMTREGPRRIERLTTEIWVPLAASADPNRLLERGAATCPVHHSLHPDVQKPVIFHYAEETGEPLA
jgi:putative redox protein